MMNNVIYTRFRKDERTRKSRWAVLAGRWRGGTRCGDTGYYWRSGIPRFYPRYQSQSTLTADTAARSPPVCTTAIPNNRPRGPALNLIGAKNWPRRNYASHILYDNIMRTGSPLVPWTRHILQWKTKLPSKYSGGPSPQLYYSEVKVWVQRKRI